MRREPTRAPAAELVLLLLLAIGVGACGTPISRDPAGPAGVDPATVALLTEHGLAAAGPTTTQQLIVGPLDEQPWSLYLEVSRAAGLDFSASADLGAELRTTPVAGGPGDVRVHALVREGAIVGAWLSSESATPGIYPLSDPPD